MTAKEEEKECDRQLLLPNTHRFRALAKMRETEGETRRETVFFFFKLSSLCLFLAAALLPSVDQTSGVEG